MRFEEAWLTGDETDQRGGAGRPARPAGELVARSLLVGTMVGALIASLAGVGRLLVPTWQPIFLIVFCTLVAIEAHWSHWLLYARLSLAFDRIWFRGGEIVALLVLGHVGDAALGGRPGGLGSITVIDLRALFTALLILVAWGASTTTASEFARLGEPPERDPTYVPPLEGLTRRFFLGGAVLLLAIGVTQVDPRRLLDATRGNIAGPVFAALIYFTLGLVLLALAQHAVLARRWQEEGSTIAAGLGGRWARLSLGFMGLTALIAIILPTAYGVGLLDLLALVVQALLILLTILGFGALGPLVALLGLLTGSRPIETPITPSEPAPPPPPPPPPESSGIPWLDIIRWSAFAIVAILLVLWLLRGWLENRDLLRAGLGRVRLLGTIGAFFRALLARLRGLATAIGERLPALRPRREAGSSGDGGGRRLRLPRARTPREQVIRYYLSLIRRAESQGLPRRPAQTPDEYAATLDEQVPEAHPDLTALTAAFVEARYSRHEVGPPESSQARTHWERLRDALRTWQRQREATAKDGAENNQRDGR